MNHCQVERRRQAEFEPGARHTSSGTGIAGNSPFPRFPPESGTVENKGGSTSVRSAVQLTGYPRLITDLIVDFPRQTFFFLFFIFFKTVFECIFLCTRLECASAVRARASPPATHPRLSCQLPMQSAPRPAPPGDSRRPTPAAEPIRGSSTPLWQACQIFSGCVGSPS